MAKILVSYYSARGGNTYKMARYVVDGVREEKVEFELKRDEDTSV